MKKRTNSIIGAILSFGITVFLASCLNPIGFDPAAIQLKVSAEVSGEIDVRSSDYAILWVINRTRSVDVSSLIISQEGTEGYPKTVAKPAHASTYASYHRPTDKPYRIDITFGPNPEDATYPPGKSEGSFSITEKYMPKAGGNYVVYLYRAQDGQLIVVEDELITKSLDPGDTENPAEPPAAEAERYPLIVRNVTADADASYVDFALNSTTLTYEGPKAKDEYLNYLAAGQYQVTAGLYKTGDTGHTNLIKTPVKNLPIIKPNDSQSWHTLYMWIYKTKSGGYGTTTTWPPNPNDAADVSISDVAGEGNGLLKIINKSESGDVIKSILLDSEPIAFGAGPNPSFIKDMEWTTVLTPGLHTVAFMPSRQTFHGITLSVQINEGEVTTLSYYDRLSDPDLPPPDEGNGSGLIKVINNSTGVVNRVIIRDTGDSSRMTSYNYEQFTPSSPINYNQTGRIGVVGDADFPITAGAHYLIQVGLNLPDDNVVIERLAALKDQVVEIVINADEINKVHGADITLVNATSEEPVQITTVTLVNTASPGQASSFSGLNWSPNGNVGPGRSAGFRVNSSVSMPITENRVFEAKVAIYGNGQTAIVTKNVGSLYDTSQTITITNSDVPPELVETFTPVTDIIGIPSTLTSYIDTSQSANTVMGRLNLNGAAVVVPDEATVTDPITWRVIGGSGAAISNNILTVDTVNSVLSDGSITIKATIAGATGSVSAKSDYTKDFTIALKYQNITSPPPDNPVTSINVDVQELSLLVGEYKSLNAKITIYPSDAHIGGKPITAADLTWSIQSGGSYVSLVNSSGQNAEPKNYAKGIAAGTAYVKATLPSGKNGGTEQTATVTVNVTQPRPTAKTIRFIRSGGTDEVETIVVVSTNYRAVSLPTYSQHTDYIGTTAYGSSNTVPLWQTGQTRTLWATDRTQIITPKGFKKAFLETSPWVTYYGLELEGGSDTKTKDTDVGKTSEKYRDLTITLDNDPANNRYFIFFMEGDKNRGTTKGVFDPSGTDKDFYFYVDLENLPEVTRNGAKVVPIFYDSYWNTASIGIRFSGDGAVNRKYPPMRPEAHDSYSFND